MLNTNYSQYIPNTMSAQYFGSQKTSDEQPDFATILAQKTQNTASDDEIYQSFLAKSGDEVVANFGLTLHKAGLENVADSMITTATNDGTIDKLRHNILRHSILQRYKELEQASGAEIGSEEFQELWNELVSTNPIVAKNPFLGLDKNEILEQLIELFENPLKNDDFDKQLANKKFAQSMLDSIHNAIA